MLDPEILTRTLVTNQKLTGGGQDQSGRFRNKSGENVLQALESLCGLRETHRLMREEGEGEGGSNSALVGVKIIQHHQS